MTTHSRSTLAQVSLAIQGFAAISAAGVLGFFDSAVQALVAKNEDKLILPAPTRLALGHPNVAQGLVIAMFAVSCIGYYWTRKKVKEEADQLVIQSVLQNVVWYLGIIYVGGVIMADMLPYFSHNR